MEHEFDYTSINWYRPLQRGASGARKMDTVRVCKNHLTIGGRLCHNIRPFGYAHIGITEDNKYLVISGTKSQDKTWKFHADKNITSVRLGSKKLLGEIKLSKGAYKGIWDTSSQSVIVNLEDKL